MCDRKTDNNHFEGYIFLWISMTYDRMGFSREDLADISDVHANNECPGQHVYPYWVCCC